MAKIEGLDKARLLKISGIGRDRLGIIHKLASVINVNGGNIVLQRSMQVVGDFAVILIAAFDEENTSGISNVIQTLKPRAIAEDFILLVREISLDNAVMASPEGRGILVKISGLDRQGIVDSISLLLLQHNLNVEFMESEVTHEPFSGTTRFSGLFGTTVPADFDMQVFQSEIYEFEQMHNVETFVEEQ